MQTKHVSSDTWSVVEKDLNIEKLGFWGSVFTLGNGYLGSRGVLEEGHRHAYAGTYLSGVYDKGEGKSFEIVNSPNPLPLEIQANGQKLGIDEMKVMKHRRTLDLRRGLLLRRTVFKDKEGNRYEYESTRFFSLDNVHLGAIRAHFRSLDCDTDVVVKSTIDGTTKNEFRPLGGPIKHYSITDAGDERGLSHLLAKTNDLGILMSFGAVFDISQKGRRLKNLKAKFYTDSRGPVQEASFRARRGVRYRVDKIMSVFKSKDLDVKDLKDKCLSVLNSARSRGVSALLKQHERAWSNAWRSSDVEIVGDEEIQRAVRFNIYHLIIAAPPEDANASIPAKALSGEWYQGHVFWDTEIFMLPFFIFVHPERARALLSYRCRRLDRARARAKSLGYSGSLWPWESALSGEDETPDEWVNFNGAKIPVYTGKREHHIASDVIYGVHQYHQATGDDDFMLQCGAEMLFETARFWASRVNFNEDRKKYEIRDVIGPNEFQECVNNNSYTNALARWTLRYAFKFYHLFLKEHPRRMKVLARRIGLKSQEVETWRKIAEGLVFLTRPDGLIEEFEGYFDRKDVTIEEWSDRGMPLWPRGVDLAEVKHTQLVKQADVVLLLHMLSDDFPLETKKVNFDYYLKRTVHKSSLSLPSHALVALELGEVEMAYEYFKTAVNADLKDVYGNTDLGIHVAALGGAWQILIRGFAGVRVKDGTLSVDPVLPKHWKNLKFRVWFRGALIEFLASKKGVGASVIDGQKEVNVNIFGREYLLSQGRKVYAKKK